MSGKVHDRELLDALERMQSQSFQGDVWRTTWKKRDPLAGGSGGGRWNAPDSFEVLYTSTERDGSIAEIYYHLSQAPVFSTSEVLVYHLTIDLKKVLHFDRDTLSDLGIDTPKSVRDDYSKSQKLSSAARFLEFQGIIVPSSRWDCNNLVVFVDQIDINENIKVNSNSPINWPAWRENNK